MEEDLLREGIESGGVIVGFIIGELKIEVCSWNKREVGYVVGSDRRWYVLKWRLWNV